MGIWKFDLGDNVILREVSFDDAKELFDLVDKNRGHLRESMMWVDGELSIEDTNRFINRAIRQSESGTGVYYCIVCETGIIGMINYYEIDKINRIAILSYWLALKWQGKGIISKAMKCLIEYAFDELEINRLELRISPDNLRSIAIANKFRFVKEGIIRQAERFSNYYKDHILYSLLKSEYF